MRRNRLMLLVLAAAVSIAAAASCQKSSATRPAASAAPAVTTIKVTSPAAVTPAPAAEKPIPVPAKGGAEVALGKPAAPADAVRKFPAAFAGRWKEYWGEPGQTDVAYNDIYQVAVAASGALLVVNTIPEHNHPIENARSEGNMLMLSELTTFRVDYRLQMSPDGKWLIGTATTPDNVYTVKWERLE
jgi:hypothetical protein